jgi:hypothetical protein
MATVDAKRPRVDARRRVRTSEGQRDRVDTGSKALHRGSSMSQPPGGFRPRRRSRRESRSPRDNARAAGSADQRRRRRVPPLLDTKRSRRRKSPWRRPLRSLVDGRRGLPVDKAAPHRHRSPHPRPRSLPRRSRARNAGWGRTDRRSRAPRGVPRLRRDEEDGRGGTPPRLRRRIEANRPSSRYRRDRQLGLPALRAVVARPRHRGPPSSA